LGGGRGGGVGQRGRRCVFVGGGGLLRRRRSKVGLQRRFGRGCGFGEVCGGRCRSRGGLGVLVSCCCGFLLVPAPGMTKSKKLVVPLGRFEMRVGKMRVGKMRVGKMRVGKMRVGR
jgi:hypothetical protein